MTVAPVLENPCKDFLITLRFVVLHDVGDSVIIGRQTLGEGLGIDVPRQLKVKVQDGGDLKVEKGTMDLEVPV